MAAELYDKKRLFVLIVDDNREICSLIKHIVECHTMKEIEADTEFDGTKALHNNRVALIIIDFNLRDYNGWDSLSLFRHTIILSDIPVVLISVEPVDMALIRQYKPDDYLQKPFDTHNLPSRVKNIIDSKGNDNRLSCACTQNKTNIAS